MTAGAATRGAADSAKPAGRHAGFARLLFDVGDRLLAALDVLLDAGELGKRFGAVLADLRALGRIVAAR